MKVAHWLAVNGSDFVARFKPRARRRPVGHDAAKYRGHGWLPKFESEAFEELGRLGESAPFSRIRHGQGCRAHGARVRMYCEYRLALPAHGIEKPKDHVALPHHGAAVDGKYLITRAQPCPVRNRTVHDIANEWSDLGLPIGPEHSPEHE